MGKISGTKKKEIKRDFQKVKFKVGKKLKKNLNETRAHFKSKALVIKKQFQLEKEGPVSHRNLSWNELLAHLNHYNLSIKMDAINSLKEISTSNYEFAKSEFSSLLESLCPLFTDREYKVREASVGLFKTVLFLFTSKQEQIILKPFYRIISVHLSCAMTHVVEAIQYSSLKLLDIIIELIPELVIEYSTSIFENFILQISKQSSKGGTKRILKNDPYKLTSTQQWRFNVLKRLHSMLLIVTHSSKVTKSSDINSLKQDAQLIDLEHMNNTPTHLTIRFNDDSKCLIHISESNRSLTIEKSLRTSNQQEFFEKYFKSITPLLVDCWVEAKPENKNAIDNIESLNIMHTVLLIFNVLIESDGFSFSEIIQISNKQYKENQIEQIFLSHFPYDLTDNLEYSDSTQINANTINLLLCKFCSSYSNIRPDKMLSIFEYSHNTINSIICQYMNKEKNANSSSNNTAPSEIKIILKLSENIFKNYKCHELVNPFFIGLMNLFDILPQQSMAKLNIFDFISQRLYEMETDNKTYEKYILIFFKKTIKYLIFFVNKKSEHIDLLISWLRRFVIKNQKSQKSVLSALQDELSCQFMNILNSIDFQSNDISQSNKKKIFEMIYWIPKITRYLFTKLAFLILQNNISIFNTNQLLEILKARIESDTENSINHSDYLMFWMNLINGYSSFELLNNQQANPNNREYIIFDYAKFQSHRILLKHAVRVLMSHKNSHFITDLLLSTNIKMILNLKNCYLSTFYGVLAVVNNLGADYDYSVHYNNISTLINKSIIPVFNTLISEEVIVNNNEPAILGQVFIKALDFFENNRDIFSHIIEKLVSTCAQTKHLESVKSSAKFLSFLMYHKGQLMKENYESINKFYMHFHYQSKSSWWNEFIILKNNLNYQ